MKPIVKTILRNIVAVIAGWIGGSIVNMVLVQIGHALFPIKGVDPNNMEALKSIVSTLDFKYFIFPLLAHAAGTLAGAIIAALIAANHKMKFALAIGALFLIGGIIVNFMIPGPLWFTIADILIAYIPMAWIGGKLITNKRKA